LLAAGRALDAADLALPDASLAPLRERDDFVAPPPERVALLVGPLALEASLRVPERELAPRDDPFVDLARELARADDPRSLVADM
jgi:hypothetical protein